MTFLEWVQNNLLLSLFFRLVKLRKMAQHYLALRPYIELLSIGENQALIIPQQIPTQNLALLRLGEHLELRQSQSRTSSLLLLLTSGGLIVYLLYKGLSEEERPSQRSQWSAQNWLRWLLFGDTNDLRGQYFGPTQTGKCLNFLWKIPINP